MARRLKYTLYLDNKDYADFMDKAIARGQSDVGTAHDTIRQALGCEGSLQHSLWIANYATVTKEVMFDLLTNRPDGNLECEETISMSEGCNLNVHSEHPIGEFVDHYGKKKQVYSYGIFRSDES